MLILSTFLLLFASFQSGWCQQSVLGQPCNPSAGITCADRLAECFNGACRCPNGFAQFGQTCLQQGKRANLRDPCNRDSDCAVPWSHCKLGKCQCRPKYVQDSLSCRPLRYFCPFGAFNEPLKVDFKVVECNNFQPQFPSGVFPSPYPNTNPGLFPNPNTFPNGNPNIFPPNMNQNGFPNQNPNPFPNPTSDPNQNTFPNPNGFPVQNSNPFSNPNAPNGPSTFPNLNPNGFPNPNQNAYLYQNPNAFPNQNPNTFSNPNSNSNPQFPGPVFSRQFPSCPRLRTDNCPRGHYCNPIEPGDSPSPGGMRRGVCCGKPKPVCPTGDPLSSDLDEDCSSCPRDTHYCFCDQLTSVAACCPRPCPIGQALLDNRCLPPGGFLPGKRTASCTEDNDCEEGEQCAEVPEEQKKMCKCPDEMERVNGTCTG